VFLTHRHQAGHLVLGETDLFAGRTREGEIGDLERRPLRFHGGVERVMESATARLIGTSSDGKVLGVGAPRA